jgi:2-polyprenyl-3-methyl-5-hydroxy-6-metoxy-1,4-benzoquinol methylase
MSRPPARKPDTPEEFGASYYEQIYNADGTDKLAIHWWANRYYARLAERLLRRAGGRRVLDVGCGRGFTLGLLGPQVDAWGIEVSKYAASHCALHAPRAKVVVGNIETGVPEGIAEGSFDVVVCRYVLEHLADPEAAMRRCASLVRPGGYFLFSVPNLSSPAVRWKGAAWFALLDPTHVSLLALDEWKRMVPRTGLILEKAFTDGFWDVPYVKRIPKLLQYGIFSLPTIAAVLFVSTALPLPLGENLIAICRKP